MKEPVDCGDSSALDFHATWPRMRGPALIWVQVVQVGQPREKPLWAALREDGTPASRIPSVPWRYGLGLRGCWSRASAGLRAPLPTPAR
jgi:hypothetical protein